MRTERRGQVLVTAGKKSRQGLVCRENAEAGGGKLRKSPGCQPAPLTVDGSTVFGFRGGKHGCGHRGCPSTPSPGAAIGPLGVDALTGRATRKKEEEKPGCPLPSGAGGREAEGTGPGGARTKMPSSFAVRPMEPSRSCGGQGGSGRGSSSGAGGYAGHGEAEAPGSGKARTRQLTRGVDQNPDTHPGPAHG